MKRRVLIIAGIVVFVLFVAIAAINKSGSSDIELVRGVKPFSTVLLPFSTRLPDTVERQYSFKMNYDDAVIAAQKELSPKGWICNAPTFEMTSLQSTTADANVRIERGRYFVPKQTAITYLGRTTTRVDPPSLAYRAYGWVTVTTYRRVGVVQDWR